MRSALLRGREHYEIGTSELIAEGPCALAISRGGAPKTYSHTDLNEDACLFAFGEGGALVAVADGHYGASGAERVVQHLSDTCATRWTEAESPRPESLEVEATEAMWAAHRGIVEDAMRFELPPAPTTLSFAIIRPAEGFFLHASIGDSHIFRVRDVGLDDLGWAAERNQRAHFLGDSVYEEADKRQAIACEGLADVRALILVTDGISEKGIGFENPAREIAEILQETARAPAHRRPADTCRSIMETTLAAQQRQRAGDNLGCAVWMAPGA